MIADITELEFILEFEETNQRKLSISIEDVTTKTVKKRTALSKQANKYISLAQSCNLTEQEKEIFKGICYENRTFLDYCDRWKIPDRARVADVLRNAYAKVSESEKFNKTAFQKSLYSQYSMKNWLL